VGPEAGVGNPKKTLPGPGRSAGRGVGPGAPVFRGPRGPVTNTRAARGGGELLSLTRSALTESSGRSRGSTRGSGEGRIWQVASVLPSRLEGGQRLA